MKGANLEYSKFIWVSKRRKPKQRTKKNNRISNSKELLELKNSLKMELKGTPNIWEITQMTNTETYISKINRLRRKRHLRHLDKNTD